MNIIQKSYMQSRHKSISIKFILFQQFSHIKLIFRYTMCEFKTLLYKQTRKMCAEKYKKNKNYNIYPNGNKNV